MFSAIRFSRQRELDSDMQLEVFSKAQSLGTSLFVGMLTIDVLILLVLYFFSLYKYFFCFNTWF